MLKDWTNSWLDMVEDSFTVPEDEEPMDQKELEEYYQSIYQDWYDTKTEDRFNQRNRSGMSDGLTGK